MGWTLPLALCLLIDAFFPTRPVLQDIAGSVSMAGSTALDLALMAGFVTLRRLVYADSIAIPIAGGGRSEVLALVTVVKVATLVETR